MWPWGLQVEARAPDLPATVKPFPLVHVQDLWQGLQGVRTLVGICGKGDSHQEGWGGGLIGGFLRVGGSLGCVFGGGMLLRPFGLVGRWLHGGVRCLGEASFHDGTREWNRSGSR